MGGPYGMNLYRLVVYSRQNAYLRGKLETLYNFFNHKEWGMLG
jgi:hypothetical protein